MATQSLTQPRIDASPAKRFFVEMLTRDIELEDAILDLLDNCVDGAVRINAKKNKDALGDKPYAKFKASIELTADSFSITDNCGGIPPEVAIEYAFRFGRPKKELGSNLHTVGVYGIGMKRALFKLGRESHVVSRHSSGAFSVRIDKKWLAEDVWRLDMKDEPAKVLPSTGVKITVTDLHKAIANQFDGERSGFVETLRNKIRDHYAYIIQKGFEVTVNGKPVSPNLIQTLFEKPSSRNATAIAPYIYETEHDGVKINLALGMYAPFPTEAELDDLFEGKRSRETAGWTVICNDRVVLSHDTSHRTGWGEAGVPQYHSQFVMISGIVEFTSDDPTKLPITTTKRGVNLDSPLYSAVKDVMREALKHFTSFTYHWKSSTPERNTIQSRAKAVDIRTAATSIPAASWQDVRKNLKGKRFVPELPRPNVQKTHARITFEKPIRDIERLRYYLELEETAKPGEVGEAAFNWTLAQAKS